MAKAPVIPRHIRNKKQPPQRVQQPVVVYPTKASALNVVHPTGGPLKATGSSWPKDGFTYRMMVQRITTEDPRLAYKGEASAVVKRLPAAPSPPAKAEART